MTFKFTITVFNVGILTREDKWFETLLLIPQTRKIDFLLALPWLQQSSTFGQEPGAGCSSHHPSPAAHTSAWEQGYGSQESPVFSNPRCQVVSISVEVVQG